MPLKQLSLPSEKKQSQPKKVSAANVLAGIMGQGIGQPIEVQKEPKQPHAKGFSHKLINDLVKNALTGSNNLQSHFNSYVSQMLQYSCAAQGLRIQLKPIQSKRSSNKLLKSMATFMVKGPEIPDQDFTMLRSMINSSFEQTFFDQTAL